MIAEPRPTSASAHTFHPLVACREDALLTQAFHEASLDLWSCHNPPLPPIPSVASVIAPSPSTLVTYV